eukprot:jgi/Hompol1/5066/HPOL_004134-RA
MDSALELRIIDVITGDDPMQEGEQSLEDEERKRLEEEGRKAALGLTGAQRVMLEDRYNQLKDAFSAKIREIGASINIQLQESIANFKVEWAQTSADGASIIDLITSQRLAQTSLDQFNQLQERSKKLSVTREGLLAQLDKDLALLEKQRAGKVELLLAKFSQQLKKLNYKRQSVVDPNLAILENRETMKQYVSTLQSINVEVDLKMTEYFATYGAKWNQARYDFVFQNFVESIRRVLDLDVQALYTRFQKQFDSVVMEQTALIQTIMDMAIEHISLSWLHDWRQKATNTFNSQALAITAFNNDLQNFESSMDNDARSVVAHWLPSLRECQVKSEDELLKITAGSKETFVQSSAIVSALQDKIKTIQAAYHDRITSMFKVDEPIGSSGPSTAAAGAVDPVPAKVSVREVEFLSKKVAEWRSEQIQQLKLQSMQADADTQAAKAKKQQTTKQKQTKPAAGAIALPATKASDTKSGNAHGGAQANASEAGPTAQQTDTTGGAAAPITTSAVKPMLLDGTEYIPEYKATQFLAAVGFVPDLTVTTKISDSVPHTESPNPDTPTPDYPENIVEIKSVQVEILSSLRQHLSQAIHQDTITWESNVTAAVMQKITQKLEQLATQRTQQQLDNQTRQTEITNISQARISSLQHLHTSHENEATFLLHLLNKLQSDYAASIIKLTAQSRDFSTQMIQPMLAQLESAKSVSSIQVLRQEFENAVLHHTIALKQTLSSSTEAYDQSKSCLLKSKLPGHHLSAWLYLRDTHYIDVDHIGQEMERWRSEFDVEIEQVQTETSNKVHQMDLEFNAYLEDFRFLDLVSRCMTEFRLKLKAQAAKFKADLNTLADRIGILSESRKASQFSWEQVLSILKDCDEIRMQITVHAFYLGCFRGDATPESFCGVWFSSIDEWKSVKSIRKPHKQIVQLSRPVSSKAGQRVHIAAAKPAAASRGVASSVDGVTASDAIHNVTFGEQSKKPDQQPNIAKWRSETRKSIQSLADAYFQHRSEKEIRKKDRIPSSSAQFVAQIDDQLAKHYRTWDQWKRTQTMNMLAYHDAIYVEFSRVINSIYSAILANALDCLTQRWRSRTIDFAKQRTRIYHTKHQHSLHLKLTLGHPRWTAELGRLDAEAQATSAQLGKCIGDLMHKCQADMEALSIEV